MLIIALLYVGVGTGLAIVTLGARGFRRRIDHLAHRIGMGAGYGRTVWLGGTVVFWPIGLYAAMTGRLAMVGDLHCRTDAGTNVIIQQTSTGKTSMPRSSGFHR